MVGGCESDHESDLRAMNLIMSSGAWEILNQFVDREESELLRTKLMHGWQQHNLIDVNGNTVT